MKYFIFLFLLLAVCATNADPLPPPPDCVIEYNFDSFLERTPWPTTHFMSSFTICMITQSPSLTFFVAFLWECVEQLLLIINSGEYGVFAGDPSDTQPETCVDSILGDMGQSFIAITIVTIFNMCFNVPIWVLPFRIHWWYAKMNWFWLRALIYAVLIVPFFFSGVDIVLASGFKLNIVTLVMVFVYPISVLVFAYFYKEYTHDAYRFFWGKNGGKYHYWLVHIMWAFSGALMISSALYPIYSVYFLSWIHAAILVFIMFFVGWMAGTLRPWSLYLLLTQSTTVFDANNMLTGYPVNMHDHKLIKFMKRYPKQ